VGKIRYHRWLGVILGLMVATALMFGQPSASTNAEADPVVITFDAKGGEVSPTGQAATPGEPMGDLPTPSRTGYTFKGWFSDDGTSINSASRVPNINSTLEAHWSASTYTVNFDATGGKAVKSKTVTFNSAYGSLPTTSLPGYAFTGWYTQASGGSQITSDSLLQSAKDITLYARWRKVNPFDHWVSVSLAHQTATLMDGKQAVTTFTISSGKPSTPTLKGAFKVYSKVASQALRGGRGADAYYYPNVKWCVWFHGNFGFHTAYWHNDFGKAVSHGCINMRQADAKKLYQWVVVGAKVVVA